MKNEILLSNAIVIDANLNESITHKLICLNADKITYYSETTVGDSHTQVWHVGLDCGSLVIGSCASFIEDLDAMFLG